MPKMNSLKTTIAESREFENMKYDIKRNKALNDYIAMMCDVSIPDESDGMEGATNEE